MGERCPYYRERRLYVRGRRTGERGDVVVAPWCSHPKHSPQGYPDALRTTLACEGKHPEQCPLTPVQFADVDKA